VCDAAIVRRRSLSNPRCCCHCDRRSVRSSSFGAVAVQQNAFSLGGKRGINVSAFRQCPREPFPVIPLRLRGVLCTDAAIGKAGRANLTRSLPDSLRVMAALPVAAGDSRPSSDL
jgi:hypothetical protein